MDTVKPVRKLLPKCWMIKVGSGPRQASRVRLPGFDSYLCHLPVVDKMWNFLLPQFL